MYAHEQPIEDIREYFGEEITLFFVWFGYLCTMLWIPAGVGVWVFAMQVFSRAFSPLLSSLLLPSPPLSPLLCSQGKEGRQVMCASVGKGGDMEATRARLASQSFPGAGEH